MLALNRRLILECLFIVLLALPFVPWMNPFPRHIKDMQLLYGDSGLVPVIEGFNQFFETMTHPIMQLFSFGTPSNAGMERITFGLRNMIIYIVAINSLGIALIFATDRAIIWKLPLATVVWFCVAYASFFMFATQTSTIMSRRSAINDQLGKTIQVSVQSCSLRAADRADEKVIACNLVVSQLPSQAIPEYSGRPSIEVSYSHPKQEEGNDKNRWSDRAIYSSPSSNDIVFSADRTTATFESELTVADANLDPEGFYISAIRYYVDFDQYTSNSMHIPLKNAFNQRP